MNTPTQQDAGPHYRARIISAEALAAYMTARHVSVRRLADAVGCSASHIGHLRSGKRDTTTVVNARKIERILNAPPASLFHAYEAPREDES